MEYIKFTDVDGPCQIEGHKTWIEITNWGWGCKREASSGNQIGLASGVAKFEDLHFEAPIGSATATLFAKMLKGQHFTDVMIHCTKNTGGDTPEVWMEVNMKAVLVMGIEQTVESDTAVDTVNLSFSQVEVKIKDQKADGKLEESDKNFSYDLTTAKAV